MTESTPSSGRRSGFVSSSRQIAEMTPGRFDDGPADGTRFIDVNPSGGLHFRILVDRGFDIGPAWHHGVQIAWLSKVGVTAPLDRPAGLDWRDRFAGGLMTTCGLDNVGAPSEGHGLHGSASHLRAHDVRLDHETVDDEVQLIARAQVDDVTSLGRHLETRRTITATTGRSLVTVEDTVTNRGTSPEPAPVLYHVNLGWPLWGPGASLSIDSGSVEARDEVGRPSASDGSWAVAPPVETGASELVYEHHGLEVGTASVTNPDVGLRASVTWDIAELPRLYQWTHPAAGVYALGIEPSNASALGRADDRAAGTLAVLEPDEKRVVSVSVELVAI